MALQTQHRWQLFVASGVGSCCGELATVPIDVVKVRMQLSGELGGASRYASAAAAFPAIVAEEGVGALYKGVGPALLRQATYGSLRIGMYEPVKAALAALTAGRDGGQPTLAHKAASGVICGAAAAAICNPTDVIKVRMQADGMAAGAARAPPRYANVVAAFMDIARTEGLRGLYKGVSPTVQRAAVVAAVELATYDEAKAALVARFGASPTAVSTHFAASLAAGFLCTVASSPLDVIKSRVMNQPVDSAGRGIRYTSTLDCLAKSVAAEGVPALWKGFWPNFGRLGPHAVVTFLVIEQVRNAFARWDTGSAV